MRLFADHGPERRQLHGASHDHEDLWAFEGNSWRASEAQPQDWTGTWDDRLGEKARLKGDKGPPDLWNSGGPSCGEPGLHDWSRRRGPPPASRFVPERVRAECGQRRMKQDCSAAAAAAATNACPLGYPITVPFCPSASLFACPCSYLAAVSLLVAALAYGCACAPKGEYAVQRDRQGSQTAWMAGSLN